MAYLLAFCRAVLGLMFAWSFVTKVQNVATFEKTITRFQLLPGRLRRPAAFLFLAGELTISMTMWVGGPILTAGFLLAALMLTTFSLALGSVLIRKQQTPCNCFGPSDRPVSYLDLVRNVGFIACALGGWGILETSAKPLLVLSIWDWVLIVVAAAVFVTLGTHLVEIAGLLR